MYSVSAVEENEGAPGFAPDFEPGLAPDFEPGLAPEYAPWFQPGYAPGLAPGDRSGGKVGVCWNIRCKESKECDSFCRDAGYSGGLCLPPAKICCCVY